MKIAQGLILLGLVFLGSILIIQSNLFQQKSDLPVLGEVKHFNLVNSEEKQVSVKDLKDKVWVANFIFTRCQGPCPMLTKKMAQVQKKFANRDDVHLVTVSVDPEFDTPDELKKYAEQHQADINKWHFLTGEREDISHLMMDEMKLGFAEDIIFHSERIVLLDKNSKIRGYYEGSDSENIEKLTSDLSKLLEAKQPKQL